MTHRERALTALRRGMPDRVPWELSLCPELSRQFLERHGTDPSSYYDFDVRNVDLRFQGPPVRPVPTIRDGETLHVDEWGVGHVSTPSSGHFEHLLHPLGAATSVREIETYVLPEMDAARGVDELRTKVRDYHDRAYAVMGGVCPLGGTVFWPAYKLRGMEDLLMDFHGNPRIAEVLLDRVTDISAALAAEMARSGVDIIQTGDDLGSQRGLLMSRDMFRRWIAGRLRKVVDAAKAVRPDVLAYFHSDGAVAEVVPDLIDAGIDILNPVQPECMDVTRMKKEYGRYLAFWGAVGTQTTMPFGTPLEVRRVVAERIRTIGAGGGFLIAPTHVLEPEVPWQNVTAFVDAVREYGAY